MRFERILLACCIAAAAACDRSTSRTPTTSAPSAASSTAAAPTSAAPSASSAPSLEAGTAEPWTASFEPVVGDWSLAEEEGEKGLKVDGSKWHPGEPSARLAEQAKLLFGERSAEFVDGVKPFASFPFAVSRVESPKGDVRISVRFHPDAGKVDQAAGILFALAADGSYWGVRANALEDNLLFFHVVKGKRTVLADVPKVPTKSKTWHTLVVELRGKQLTAAVDGQQALAKTLDFAPSGRIGLWSKADSQVFFSDFRVESLAAP